MRSSPQLRSSVEGRKKHLIHLLINNGIYKKSERHLYELSLGELESEYKYVRRCGLMAKRKIKTYEQLIKENKAAIMNNQKLMNVIYDRIDRKHQKLLRHNSHT
ncbi:Fur-regulated basic protein FbpB [Bacillus velezensis]|nr:hypothetical protein CEA92_07155 [Bacillus velezensis]QEQ06440.1 Fur-regulated basic protein FbpB [Bacillus velezensis]